MPNKIMKTIILSIIFIVFTFWVNAQNITITPSGITPVTYTSFEKLTYAQIQAKTGMQNGDTVYDLTYNILRVYNGNKWLGVEHPQKTEGEVAPMVLQSDMAAICAIEHDSQNNIYVAGSYSDSISLSPTVKLKHTAGNYYGIFVAKYSTTGTLLSYIHEQSNGNSFEIKDFKIDNLGNLLICGLYSGTVNFGGTTPLTAPNLGYSNFVAKYTSSMTLLWAKSDVANAGQVVSIDYDNSNNIYIAGNHYGTISLNNGMFSRTSAGQYDVFIAKYTPTGIVSWLSGLGGTSDDYLADMICTGSYLYLTGTFYGTTTIGTNIYTSNGVADYYLAQANLTGTFQNSLAGGGPDFDSGNVLVEDSNYEIYLGGGFYGSFEFDGKTFTSNGNQDMFIAKLIDNSGSGARVSTDFYLSEMLTFGSVDPTVEDVVSDAVSDDYSNVYFAGKTGGLLAVEGHSTAVNNGAFVLRRNHYDGFLTTGLFSFESFGEHQPTLTKDTIGNVFVSGSILQPKTIGTTYINVTDPTTNPLLVRMRIN